MIDFYVIADNEQKPNPKNIDKLEYAGGIESDIYERLIKKGIIDSRFDFYSDFRWGNQLVRQLDSKTEKIGSDSDISALKRIIDKALNSESGLIAYGD